MVIGLNEYLKQKKMYKNINIEGAINEYKKNTNKKPIIAIDYKASQKLFRTLTNVNVCCAGREKLVRAKAEFFFKTLTEKFDCKLVFFLDGLYDLYKIEEYVEILNNIYNKFQTYFNITNGIDMTNTNIEKKIHLPIYYDNILEIAKKYCEIRIELNKENYLLNIAKYANDEKIFALIVADTNFIIMKGDYQIWDPNTINLENLTIDCLKKNEIRERLNLSENQMAIYATLSGNTVTVIPRERIKKLFKEVYPQTIAKYTHKNYPKGIQTKDYIKKLCEFLYHNGENGLKKTEAENMIRDSLNFYNIDRVVVEAEENTIKPKWLTEHIQFTKSTFVYIVLNDIFFRIGLDLIHLDMPNTSKQYSELILQLVLRQMGVILKDFENREQIKRKIFYKPSHDEPFKIYELKPIFPNFDLPKIQDIVDKSFDQTKKIDLISWLVSPTSKQIDTKILRDILDTDYFIPILILNYFVGVCIYTVNIDVTISNLNSD